MDICVKHLQLIGYMSVNLSQCEINATHLDLLICCFLAGYLLS